MKFYRKLRGARSFQQGDARAVRQRLHMLWRRVRHDASVKGIKFRGGGSSDAKDSDDPVLFGLLQPHGRAGGQFSRQRLFGGSEQCFGFRVGRPRLLRNRNGAADGCMAGQTHAAANQIVHFPTERHRMAGLQSGQDVHRDRQQHLALIAEIHERPQGQTLGRGKLQRTGGYVCRQAPVNARRLTRVPGIDPVDMPSGLNGEVQASEKVMIRRDGCRAGDKLHGQMRRTTWPSDAALGAPGCGRRHARQGNHHQQQAAKRNQARDAAERCHRTCSL